jgi:hypothetical protein
MECTAWAWRPCLLARAEARLFEGRRPAAGVDRQGEVGAMVHDVYTLHTKNILILSLECIPCMVYQV